MGAGGRRPRARYLRILTRVERARRVGGLARSWPSKPAALSVAAFGGRTSVPARRVISC